MTDIPKVTPGGGKANRTGNQLEAFVEFILNSRSYGLYQGVKKHLFEERLSITNRTYAKQVPCGESIYGTRRKCDFLVLNPKKFPNGLIIECKWQQRSGSVDEKYPFTVLNVIKIGVPTIILIDGAGYKKQAVEWLRSQINPASLVGVYTMAEFQTLVNNDFLG